MKATPGSKRATHRTRVRSARVTLTPHDAAVLRTALGPTLTRDDAASIAGVTRRTIDRWRRHGLVTSLSRAGVSVEASTLREHVVLDTDSVLAMITREVTS